MSAGDISGALSNPLARGPSAYEVAVANGFEGTESEWLESLHGEDGADGYTPRRGVDYWTAEDIQAIKDYIESVILGGAW